MEYASNSHKSKEEPKEVIPEKKVEKVITGIAKTKKKSGFAKLTDIFISEDVDNVKSFILIDVLVPAIKQAISDIVTNGIDMVLYGESGHKGKSSVASKVSYRSYYDKPNSQQAIRASQVNTRYSYDDIILESRGEGEQVLSRMAEIIDVYGTASVADLCELVGKTGSYTDNKYGWSDIRSAEVLRIREGYLLKFPKALPLD